MAWRKPTKKWVDARLRFYKQAISDDIAEWMAWRLPMRSKAARRALMLMRRAVKKRYRKELALDPRYTYQEAIDDTTTDILNSIEAGEELDWALYYLASP